MGGVVVSNTFKVGKAFYPTLKKAYNAALKNTPMLKASLGWLEKKLTSVEQVVTKNSTHVSETLVTKDVQTLEKKLLEGEGRVGTYGELKKIKKPDDNLARHHIPNDQYMSTKGVSKNDGISIMVEHPIPGKGGRHREIHKELSKQDITLEPRQALAQGIFRAREVYQKDNLYTQEIRKGLEKVIEKNKERHPNLFEKK